MHLALWDCPPSECLLAASGRPETTLEVERHDARTCARLLREQQVDVALLPSMVALSGRDDLDVLPGSALSTWAYPFARLVLRREIGNVKSVAFAPWCVQEALIARIMLREHYGQNPAMVPIRGATAADLLRAEEDASLIVGAEAPPTDRAVLDLGQEWFELAQYPMVWGLFVSLKEAASPTMVEAILTLAKEAEEIAYVWGQDRERDEDVRRFYAESLRLRLDDLAMASLTKFGEYLYYYNVTDELPVAPLYVPPGKPHNADTPWWASPD